MTDVLFEITTPLGTKVRATAGYWARIVTFKHPVMRDKLELVKHALAQPIEVRRSKSDKNIHLYYGPDPPYIVCVVVKSGGSDGFVVTAYRTDKAKEGEKLWPHP